jgi:hypothetical protein
MYLFMKPHFSINSSVRTIFLFLICFSIAQSTLYGQSEGLYAKLKEVGHICEGSPATGFIEFELLGPPEEFTYYWSNGEEGLRIENLEAGIYTLYVTNAFGCEEVYEVEILEIMECKLVYEIKNMGKCQAMVELFVYSGDNELITESLNIVWQDGSNLQKRTFDIRRPLSMCVSVTTKSDIPCCRMETCISVSKTFCEFVEPPNNPNCHLIVNEFGGRKNDKRQYVELLVYNDKTCYCDLTNFIIDDNNGEIIKGNQNVNENTKERIGVDKGYLAFQKNENWASVQNGSLILIYDGKIEKGEKGETAKIEGLDPWDSNGDGVYVLTADDSEQFYAKKGVWDYANSMMKYEESLSELPKWDHIVITDFIDGLQTRYPNGDLCHALSHGSNLYSELVDVQNTIWKDNNTKDCTCAFEGNLFTATDHFSCSHEASPGKANSEANDKIIKTIKEQCEKEFAGKRSFSPDPSEETVKKTQQKLIVFPNPVTEKLSVKFLSDVSGIADMSIYSVSGYELYNSSFLATKGENIKNIDVSNFMIGGVYFIKFRYPSGKQDFVKFIGIDDK